LLEAPKDLVNVENSLQFHLGRIRRYVG